MPASTGPVEIPDVVARYFRAGGKIRRTYFCGKHGAVRSILVGPISCPTCSIESQGKGRGA